MYYVYLHIRLDTGEPFYVGKGKANRSTSTHGRNAWWHNIVNKSNLDIVFLHVGLSGEEAEKMEKYWIKRLGRKDLELGCLVNLTDGGEGVSGRKTKGMKGEANPFYGKKHTKEVGDIIRESNKRRVYSKESQEKRIKNRKIQTLYGEVDPRSRLIINMETGIFYTSIREAANAVEIREDSLRHQLNGRIKNKTNLRIA